MLKGLRLLVRRALPERVERLLARGLLRGGGVGWGRFIDRVQAGLLRDLLEGLVCRALPERVERLLARGLLRVGDVCWGLVASAASPMASATASSPRVLIRWACFLVQLS